MKHAAFLLLVFSSAGFAAIRNFHTVRESVFYRSARPDKADYQHLKSLGVKTVVNLEDREQHGEESWARDNQMDYVRIPIGGSDCPTMRDINEALDVITDESRQPVLVHCYRGADRTGIIAAAYRIRYDRWTPARAIQELRSYGHAEALYHCDSILYDVN